MKYVNTSMHPSIHQGDIRKRKDYVIIYIIIRLLFIYSSLFSYK